MTWLSVPSAQRPGMAVRRSAQPLLRKAAGREVGRELDDGETQPAERAVDDAVPHREAGPQPESDDHEQRQQLGQFLERSDHDPVRQQSAVDDRVHDAGRDRREQDDERDAAPEQRWRLRLVPVEEPDGPETGQVHREGDEECREHRPRVEAEIPDVGGPREEDSGEQCGDDHPPPAGAHDYGRYRSTLRNCRSALNEQMNTWALVPYWPQTSYMPCVCLAFCVVMSRGLTLNFADASPAQ